MDYRSRWCDPCIMQFTSPDTLIPDLYNSLDWNRYAYARGNPLRYTDPDGHIAIPVVLVIAAVVVLKVIDYGWTAYDVGSAIATAIDSNNSPEIRQEALGNAAAAVGMELLEPDDLLPVALPVDDIIRHADDIGEGLIRAVPLDQMGTSQAFKTFKGEDGLSVFEGVLPEDVLSELPGNRVPNTTVTIPKSQLPDGTKVIPTAADGLSQMLSDAHRILVRPEGWSVDRFAKALKEIVGWK